ncbi:MAG: acyltransferase [Archaeoglobaceae archaeon]|nr:acyltransferase [Archaeoglobaceae archaeon]MDW8117774.1 acyltransferase [Archaeoglobaceae archaeon]
MLDKMLIRKAKFEERTIVADGDVLIGQNSRVDYGILAKRLVAGERVNIGGDILGEEVRVDSFCTISGDLISKGDAYIGEFAGIDGKLTVYGDLEIGRNVRIKNGFEARGLITIQNPASVIFFLLLYIMLLFRLGRIEEVFKLIEDVELEPAIILPEKCSVEVDKIVTTKSADIFDSKILGTLRARDIYVGGSEIIGGIRGREVIVDNSKVHGSVEGRTVYLVNSCTVGMHVKGDRVYMEKGCIVEGGIIAREGVWIKDQIELKTDFGEEFGVGKGEVQENVSESLSRSEGQIDSQRSGSS